MNEQSIFLAASEIRDPAERQAYVSEACAGDESLRRQVESLLAAHEQPGEFLDVPVCEQMGARACQELGGTVALDRNAEGEEIVAEPKWPASPNDTHAEQGEDEKDERNLDFLQAPTRPGTLGRLAHYEVLEVLGKGGFGTVVKAFDEKLHRMVAIKIMSPQLATTSPARKRFLREARSSAAIRHENVVDIHAIEEQPVPFLVMEYVAGQTLQQRLNRVGPLETLETLRIGVQIAHGLAAAHAMGKIHRDIKPANILLENGVDRVKITDFGLARAADDASLTQSGVIAGTPMYMAPEQAQGVALDHRADLFSFGSVLYVMCSGRPPFRASTTLAVLKRVAEDTPRPIREIIPEVPEWLCNIITRLHAKKPEDRFASAKEVADLLAHCLAELQLHGKVQAGGQVSQQTTATPAAAPTPGTAPTCEISSVPTASSPPPIRHRRRRLAVAAALFLMMLVGLSLTEATGVTNLSGTVIRLFSSEGTLIVEVDDPDVSVSIEGEEIVIKGAGTKEIRVKPGQYKVQATKDGKVVRQELVTITKNGRQVVRISREVTPVEQGDPDRKAAEYVLSIGGAVRVNEQEQELKAAADLPRQPFRLTYVDLRENKQLSDAGLAPFKDCKNLMWLDLNNTRVSDAGLAHFKDCKNLTNLGLRARQVTDTGLAYFKDCKNLAGLTLSNTQVSDAGLAHFKDCKDLTFLDLNGTKVSDVGLAYFKYYKNLTFLGLALTQVSDAGLAYFRDCKDLTTLFLDGTQVSDVGLANFKDSKNLSVVHLHNTQVTNAGLANFKECKNLTRLTLQKTKVTAAGIDELKKALPQCNIAWDGGVIEPTLSLDADRKAAAWVLSIGGAVRVNEQDRDLKAAADLPREPFRLTLVDLRGCKQASDVAMGYFTNCKNLINVTLSSTTVSDEGLAHFKNCKSLTNLTLKNTKVTGAGIDALKKALPQCKIEWDGGVIEPTAGLDPDHTAAEWVLSLAGSVTINGGQERALKAAKDLSAGPDRHRRDARCRRQRPPGPPSIGEPCRREGQVYEAMTRVRDLLKFDPQSTPGARQVIRFHELQ